MIRAIVLIAFLIVGPTAFAHRLYVGAVSRPGPPPTLRIEAWFEGDIPAESAKIVLTDSQGTSATAGIADDTGILTIALPAPGVWVVAAESVGHRGECTIAVGGDEPPNPESRATGPEWWRVVAGPAIVLVLFVGLRMRLRRRG